MKYLILSIVFLLTFSVFAQESVGEQKTAIVFFDLLEDGKEPSIELFQKAIFESPKSVNHFIKEVSHQKTWLTGKTYPWIKLKSLGRDCFFSHEEVLETIIQHKIVDLSKIDRVLAFYNFTYDKNCSSKFSFGFSTHGKEPFMTSMGEMKLSVAQFHAKNRFVLPQLPFQPLSGITSSVIAHELGHSFGSRGHSNILDCGKLTVDFDRAHCTQSAIADMFSLLAGEGFFRPALHFSACHKQELGWIGEEDQSLLVINKEASSRVMTVKLRPYTTVGKNVAVKINLQSPIPVPCVNPENCNVSIQSLFLEYRTAHGFDENISKLRFESERKYDALVLDPAYYGSSKEINTTGIQIRGGFYKNGYCITSYNLDVTPESIHAKNRLTNEILSYALYDNLDSFLTPGNSFVEPRNGLRITTKEIDQEGNAVVEIHY